MAVQGGFGLSLKIDVAGTPTVVVGVRTADFPGFSKFIAESTPHDAEDGYYEAVATGKRRLQPFSAELNWDASETTHATVLAAFDSNDAVAMSISDPAGDEEIAFFAHIETVNRISQQEDRYYATVQFHPTGAPTIT
jgi:hypothetical protein